MIRKSGEANAGRARCRNRAAALCRGGPQAQAEKRHRSRAHLIHVAGETMFKSFAKPAVIVAGIMLASAMQVPAQAADFEVQQKNKQFSQKALTLKVGDAVSFRNEDPFAHNIFSLSDVKTFDLGTYPQGQAKKVVFDKPGTVEIECAIHPAMKMPVEVKK
jgi:plastocyanin